MVCGVADSGHEHYNSSKVRKEDMPIQQCKVADAHEVKTAMQHHKMDEGGKALKDKVPACRCVSGGSSLVSRKSML